MSVALLIKKSPLAPQELLPIASEETYQDHWVNRASQSGLEWIPLFQSGLRVPLESLSAVILEFEQIQKSFQTEALLELAARAEAAANALREVVRKYPDAEVFIG